MLFTTLHGRHACVKLWPCIILPPVHQSRMEVRMRSISTGFTARIPNDQTSRLAPTSGPRGTQTGRSVRKRCEPMINKAHGCRLHRKSCRCCRVIAFPVMFSDTRTSCCVPLFSPAAAALAFFHRLSSINRRCSDDQLMPKSKIALRKRFELPCIIAMRLSFITLRGR